MTEVIVDFEKNTYQIVNIGDSKESIIREDVTISSPFLSRKQSV